MKPFTENGIQLHRWDCGPSTFIARPELGARLMRWDLKMAGGAQRRVLHWPDAPDSADFARIRGGNPILFPFAARTYHKGKVGQWQAPDGTLRPMPQHGFARGGKFSLVATSEKGFTAALVPDEAAREAYPFDYRFRVRYAFEALSFQVFLELENLGAAPIPWSAGHHFYFTLPWHEGSSRKDYRFIVPAKNCFTHAPNGTLEAIKPFAPESHFGDPKINDRIYTRLKNNELIFGPQSGEEEIGIRLLKDSDTFSMWNAFVLWTEAADSPFFCVEPWMGPPNSPEHRKGLHFVNPGETASFGVEVALR